MWYYVFMAVRLAEGKEITRILHDLADQVEKKLGLANLAIIGIKRRGAILAKRLQTILEKKAGQPIFLGYLDITLYRDDFSALGSHPVVSETEILFNLEKKKILLVDDVLFTGRTIRAALDAIIDFGRPSYIRLLVLIDRNHREFPIQPDFVGRRVKTTKKQMVEVHLQEIDGAEEVLLIEPKP
ncbi:MAG: bifunctional pyr operon transcriptional regulator/uracil phosphoribosyltransferase PyrR [Candidatus Omnitrophica bacterium]|nr:bifunctional pyr operon transcriptional regulator/uracil phosphoribosyltransferase PyrR [Candidatus Omnitrophota bacterium]